VVDRCAVWTVVPILVPCRPSSSWLPSVRGKEETMAMACLCCDPAKSLSPFACYGYVDCMVPYRTAALFLSLSAGMYAWPSLQFW
jgi:hypothetical protein